MKRICKLDIQFIFTGEQKGSNELLYLAYQRKIRFVLGILMQKGSESIHKGEGDRVARRLVPFARMMMVFQRRPDVDIKKTIGLY